MVMEFLGLRKKKNLSEMEEESDYKDAEISLEKKRVMLLELKKRGLEAKHFGNTSEPGTWTKIYNWLKSH